MGLSQFFSSSLIKNCYEIERENVEIVTVCYIIDNPPVLTLGLEPEPEPEPHKDYEAKMFQAILMTTFSLSLFVRQRVQAKEHKESL
jgi:hypothetical protein